MAFRRWGMNSATAWFRTAEHPSASLLKAPHEVGCAWPHPDADLIAHARTDLEWAVEEIDYLRQRNDALSHLAFALDGLRWALENAAPDRIEHWRRAEEEARRAVCDIPISREGECRSGCRRYATHELVIERADEITRKPQCEECGARKAAARRAAIAAGHWPAATVRLEPLARQKAPTERAREGRQ